MTRSLSPISTRGPADHAVRDRIIQTAGEHFAHYGYEKTTVADLARELGFSKTYVYRFFESKQAIGEEIIRAHLSNLLIQARDELAQGTTATEKFRRFFASIVVQTVRLSREDKRIYEIAIIACNDDWSPATSYAESLQEIIADIIRYGRERGEFEKKTPADEVVRSIFFAMVPFVDPTYLRRTLKHLPSAQVEIAGLILRSLAP